MSLIKVLWKETLKYLFRGGEVCGVDGTKGESNPISILPWKGRR